MRRCGRLVVVCALLLCGGCASLLPNTATAIAPATFDDLLLGFSADMEQLAAYLSIFLGI